jgi:hypothetical protein
MAESYLDQGLEGWVDGSLSPSHGSLGCRERQLAGLFIGVLAVPTAGAPDFDIEKDIAWVKL